MDRTELASVAYDDHLRAYVQANLARHERREHPLDGRKLATVAVVLVDSDHERHGKDPRPEEEQATGNLDGIAGGPAILLTKRVGRLNRHAGQWALPGGRVDTGESADDAVRRELHEELGLALDPQHVLGMLDDYPTRSGYVIRPYVLWGGADPELTPAPDEVASVHRLSLQHLCREDSPRTLTIPESDRPVLQLLVGERFIHAPTGAVLFQFRLVGLEGLTGDDCRVDHYEQPVFAWK